MQRKKGFVGLNVVLILFLCGPAWGMLPKAWEKIKIGILEPEITHIDQAQDATSQIYFSTKSSLYSVKNKEEAKRLINIPSGINQINNLSVLSKDIYFSTNDGLWHLDFETQSWNKVFQSSDQKNKNVEDIKEFNGLIYLATSGGLWVGLQDKGNWHKVSALDGESIYGLEASKNYLWAFSNNGVWQMERTTRRWSKAYQASSAVSEETIDEDEIIAQERFIKDLYISTENEIVLASSNQIISSQNDGKSWNNISTTNLPLADLTKIIISSFNTSKTSQYYVAATHKGVFLLKDGYWESLYQGLISPIVNDMIIDDSQTLWIATAQGIFHLTLDESFGTPLNSDVNAFLNPKKQNVPMFLDPTIKQVQAWAIGYADVHPNKIKDWQDRAKRKAMLPSFSVGIDRDATEIFHWDTGPNPDVLQKGRDLTDWGMSLSWDLGELIWNNDQTSIDSRSKLMVELREDILDQVTRLYFERKRLVLSRSEDSLEAEQIDLRIEELTALLDGYTGGRFSEYVVKNQ